MTDEQIKHMVNRFLQWKLPESFHPDNGISFKPTFNDSPEAMRTLGLTEPMKCNPVGTNLFDATQAEAMARFMVEGMPGKRGTDTTSIAADFRRRAHACRTNMDGYDASAAAIWDLAAEAAEAVR